MDEYQTPQLRGGSDVAEAAVGGLVTEYEKKLEDGRQTRSDLRKRLKTASLHSSSHCSPHAILQSKACSDVCTGGPQCA